MADQPVPITLESAFDAIVALRPAQEILRAERVAFVALNWDTSRIDEALEGLDKVARLITDARPTRG